MARIAVLYIAFAPYGPDALARFASSYRRYSAGMPHELVIAFKGFASEEDVAQFSAGLSDVGYRTLVVPDGGYDIGTYAFAARALSHERFCFLNTQSEILCPNWLWMLENAASQPRVAVAGASASYQSLLTDHMAYLAKAPRSGTLRERCRQSAVNTLRHRWQYPSFPNPHLRTNAFVVDRTLWLSLTKRKIRSKRDASRFENGCNSLTRTVDALGMKVVVATRDGRVLTKGDWPTSGTFWEGGQSNLIIADNQSRKYAAAGEASRAAMTRAAWESPLVARQESN